MHKFKQNILFGAGRAREGVKRLYSAGVHGKAATSSGWATAAVDELPLATLAASLSTKKLVIPLTGLKVGDIITGFHLIGQIESGGNTVTMDCDLRKVTAVAADVTDASVATMTQLSVTADTAVTLANTSKTGLTETVADGVTYYLLISATTTGSTDIALQGAAITVKEQ